VLRVGADEDAAARLQKEEVRGGGEPAQGAELGGGATKAHKLQGRPSTAWAPSRTRRRKRRARDAAAGRREAELDVEGDGGAQAVADAAGDGGAAVAGGSASLRFGDEIRLGTMKTWVGSTHVKLSLGVRVRAIRPI
jgi:hypothetical protein